LLFFENPIQKYKFAQYNGYNFIKIIKKDEENTCFIVDLHVYSGKFVCTAANNRSFSGILDYHNGWWRAGWRHYVTESIPPQAGSC
jgi:hypothetical protein